MKPVISIVAIATALLLSDRLVGQEPSAIPQPVLDDWSYFIGDWQVEGQVGQTQVTGTAKFKWSQGKQSYIGEQVWKMGQTGNAIHLSLLGGWDSSKNQTVEQGFDSTGGIGTTRYEIQADDSFPATKSGTIDGYSRRGGAWSGTTSIKRISPARYELSTTIDGDRLHTLTFRKQATADDR